MRWLPPSELQNAVEVLAAEGFCPDPRELAREYVDLLTPPEDISTVDCAEKFRKLRTPTGGALIPYDRWQTPYNVGPMNAGDDPACRVVVMVKPSRSGGTAIAENYLFKLIRYGPMCGVGWYLASEAEAKTYAARHVAPMFEDHSELAAKIGDGPSDNNNTAKTVAGFLCEWMEASHNKFTNREPPLMVLDETDGWAKAYRGTPLVHIDGRQKRLGNQRKAFVMSHPDRGWSEGVAEAWTHTSRGVFVMQCMNCGLYAAAHATKFWPDVPQFRLYYEKLAEGSMDARVALAGETAAMRCPHCDSDLDDKQRHRMIDEASARPGDGWMHRGQMLDPAVGVLGVPDENPMRGFWVHGLMLKVMTVRELAEKWEAAVWKWQTTRKSDTLREFMCKQLGEIFEGKAALAGVSAASLQERARAERVLQAGECPPHVRFIVASVDVGSAKFDVSWWGFDLEGRAWWLDRTTLTAHEGHTIKTRERIEDWDILLERVIPRRFPIIGRPGWEMPTALTLIDIGDGNVVHKGREFANRALRAGHYWGPPADPYAKVKLIRGHRSATAPELPTAPTKTAKDEAGRVYNLRQVEFSLGVHKLKEWAVEALAVNDGGPGQCLFAEGIAVSYFEEFFNEVLVDGEWIRSGPNESLDLFAYARAGVLMLNPDSKRFNWSDETKFPPWAKPVHCAASEEGGDPAAGPRSAPEDKPTARKSIFERFEALNEGN